MFLYFLPVLVVVVANVIYDICAKSIPDRLNPFAGLTLTYSILAVATFILFFILSPGASIITEMKEVNWAVFAFALTSVGLETGYILLFRAGWDISIGGLVCNIILAIALVFVGFSLFHEHITPRQIAGVILCLIGLIIINWSDIKTIFAKEAVLREEPAKEGD